VEGSGCGLIEALSRNLSGVTEEHNEAPQSGYVVSLSRFEQSWIRLLSLCRSYVGKGVRIAQSV
jgi:hypothetical protein